MGWGGGGGLGHSLLLLRGSSVFHQMEEIELVLVVRFVVSLMVLEISLDITLLISQLGREKTREIVKSYCS